MKEEIYTEVDGVLYNKWGDAVFTEEMKDDHLLLVPTMCTIHFGILKSVLTSNGYNVELLDETDTKSVAEFGLKYVHNDTCYPAILVIGELMQALMSGRYDPHKVALVLAQTGGGCRASNYVYLLKKALKKSGYGYVPVLSLNFTGQTSQPGFQFSLKMIHSMIKATLYGDLLMDLKNQCEPYEVNKGETAALTKQWMERISDDFLDPKYSKQKYGRILQNYDSILESFSKIELEKSDKPKVGIVGEIFVKYSPLGNNELEKFLVSHGAEVIVPNLTDFLLYCIYNNVSDHKLYGGSALRAKISNMLCNHIIRKEKDLQKLMSKYTTFRPMSTFDEVVKMRGDLISEGVKMGEGWFLTAEVAELIHADINNVVITQPFGCLPNHIIAKGMMKRIKEHYPSANLIAVDYDASASKVNQDNRLRLMLANACVDDEIPLL